MSKIINLKLELIEDNNEVEVMIPTENIIIKSKETENSIKGRIIKKRYAGEKTYFNIEVDGEILKATSSNNDYEEGELVYLFIEEKNIVCF